MAFALFRKRGLEPVAPALEPAASPTIGADLGAAEADSAKEILELLDLEIGGMIRRLERAARSVAGGADAAAKTRDFLKWPVHGTERVDQHSTKAIKRLSGGQRAVIPGRSSFRPRRSFPRAPGLTALQGVVGSARYVHARSPRH